MKKLFLFFYIVISGAVFGWFDLHVIGVLEQGDSITAIRVRDSIMYVSNGVGGVIIADISDPTAPSMITSMSRGYLDYAASLYLFGDTLLVINDVFSCYNVSNPWSPIFIDSLLIMDYYLYTATRWGDTIAVGSLGNWHIIDFSDILAPSVLFSGLNPRGVLDITKAGDLLVISSDYLSVYNRLYIYDISDPTAPILLCSYTLPDSAKMMGVRALNDTLIFLGGCVLNIVDPALPSLVSVVPLINGRPPFGDWCTIINDTAYMVQFEWGDTTVRDLIVVDLTDPSAPTIVSEYLAPNWRGANAVAVRNDTVFMGYYDGWYSPGLIVLAREATNIGEKDRTPSSIDFSVFPNPFNSVCEIRLNMPEKGKLEIFDVIGRKVAEFPVSSGDSRLTWDAKDMQSGLYLLRLMFRDESVEKRAILIK